MTQTPTPPAGWYPQDGQERWWNGMAWSDNFRPLGSEGVQATAPMTAQPGQVPYGQQPYGQPAYGQPTYPQPGATQPYYAAPTQQSHTARNLLIGFGIFFVLIVGGCAAGVAVIYHRVDNVVNDDTPGGPNNPLPITAGNSFEVAGFEYADGWSVGPDDVGDFTVTGLKLHNGRDKSDYIFVILKLRQGNEVLAQVECTGPNGEKVAKDETVTLECIGTDAMPTAYDEITIQDSF